MTYSRNTFHSDHIVEMVQYLKFVPNLNLHSCRSRFIRAEGRLDAHVLSPASCCKSEDDSCVGSSICFKILSLYLTIPLQAVNQSCSCLSRKFIPPLPADALHLCLPLSFCSFSFFLFLSPSLASSLAPTNLRLSLLLLTAAEKHVPILPSNLRAGRMMGLVDCGTWRCFALSAK